MPSFRKNMVKLCGKAVHPTGTSCGRAGDLSDHSPAGIFGLGIIPHLSDLLYYSCTHLLHSTSRLPVSVKTVLYPLSTPPTITITTNI